MTAIAAVLALSSTPLAAQEATSADVALVTVPAPEPSVPATDPLAPATEAEVSAPVETTSEVAEPAKAAPVVKKAAVKAERRVTRTASAPATPVATPATDEALEPATAPIVAAGPTAELVPVEQAEPQPEIDEAIPLAGGAGAVILALAGAGMAIRRRRRSEEEESEQQDEMILTDEVTPVPAPEPWNPPVVEPLVVSDTAARTDASEDFDTSRFGRHVQAAYRGPTPENPSMSLRKRLKLAGELDRRERIGGTAPKGATPETAQPTGFMLGGTATQAKAREYQF